MIFKTLRFRFAVWVAGLLFVILVGFGIFVYATLKQSLMNAVDKRLERNAHQIQAVVEDGEWDLADLETVLNEQDISAQIVSVSGEVVFRYGHNLPTTDDLPTEQAITIPHPNESDDTMRVYVAPIYTDDEIVGFIEVTETLDMLDDTLERLQLLLFMGIPMFAVGAGIGGYVLVARALGRIDRIREMAQQISSEDLSARLGLPDIDDEVGRLAKTFDRMLERLDGSFRRERQFANDAAHELRTPLTAMRTILEMIRAKRRPIGEYEEALDDLGGEVNRLQRLVDDLLRLVRQEAGRVATFEAINLSVVLTDLCESLRLLAESKGLSLGCHMPPDMQMMGDSDEIIRLFFNLLDNAIKFTDTGAIMIEGNESAGDMLIVRVKDTGKGIGTEHLPFIFDRFYQVEASRSTGGSGLGLSIVKQIVEAHQGRIEVTSTPSQGTVFTVFMPSAQASSTSQRH